MSLLVLCSSCACHIKPSEALCPFCGASLTGAKPTPTPWAGWAVVGTAVAAMSCSSASVGPLATVDSGNTPDANTKADVTQPAGDAAHEAATPTDAKRPPSDAVVLTDVNFPPSDAGAIACGDASCTGGSQLCVLTDGITATCASSTCTAAGPADGSFGPSALCECYVPDASTCSCQPENEAGVVTCISHTCYGSPPRRDRSRRLIA